MTETGAAEAIDKEALWKAASNCAHSLDWRTGYLLKFLCWVCGSNGRIGYAPGDEATLMTAEDTQRSMQVLQDAGYFSAIEDGPDGVQVYTLDADKIIKTPPVPELPYPKGRICYEIDFEKIFGCPLVKREKV